MSDLLATFGSVSEGVTKMSSGKGKMVLLLAVLVAAALKTTVAQDYCNPDLCDPGDDHIGCNNPGGFTSNCPSGAKVIKMTDELKKIILDEHNKYRSTVATGGQERPIQIIIQLKM